MKEIINEGEMRLHLVKHVKDKYGPQAAAARAWGMSDQEVSEVLSPKRKRRPTAVILQDVGYDKVRKITVRYRRRQP